MEEGFVRTSDGLRLYYQKLGSGPSVAILPARLFLAKDFARLAKNRSLIFYDMRNRGLSDAVGDDKQISIQNDVRDLETIRAHFGVEKPDLIGFSYLGLMVMLYAMEHPDHVNRIVQIGPLGIHPGTKFPAGLTAQDEKPVPDPADQKKLLDLYQNGYAREHAREYCEQEWQITRFMLVGNPANVDKLGAGPCAMANEWPVHLYPHFQALFSSIQGLTAGKDDVAKISVPVLTIHGTKDRNAAYGFGREWNLMLPNARLISIPGAAHMSWVEAPETIFPSIEEFLNGKWPAGAEKVTSLEPNQVK